MARAVRPFDRNGPLPATALALLLAAALATGCSGGAGSDGDGGTGDDDGSISDGDGGAPAPDADTTPCDLGDRDCADTAHERVCEEVDGVPRWVAHACAEYSYCLVDRCQEACLDECALGATRTSGGDAETCRIYSTDEGGFVAPNAGTHDRARQYDAWMHDHNLANGYVAEALHSDTSYATVTQYFGTVDSAEWTGVYLAAEALRLSVTDTPEAEADVEALVERIHQLFQITGDPGYLARFWAPLGQDARLDALYDAGDWSHHQTTFQGGSAFWHGWTSRDMYSGAMLGLALAYDALHSESHREMIRNDVVTLARELLEDRPEVPVTVRYYAFGDWVETPLTYHMQHVILVPSEMRDGRVFIQVGTDEDPSDYGMSELIGAREFLTDFQSVLGQTPVIGGLVPSIPRTGSALMLAHFLRLAIHVTEDQPSWAADHAAIEAHYLAHQDEWLAVMEQSSYLNESECWKAYFGLTISFHSLFGLLRLEPDATLRGAIQQNVLADRMWATVKGHKNPYFDYITAAQGPAGLVTAGELADTAAQVGQFPAPPKARFAVDNRDIYPEDPDCPGLSTTPVDVGDRVATDFLWQHHPFEIYITNPEPRLVYAGADYLIAYWLGRHIGALDDDRPDTCTRWSAD